MQSYIIGHLYETDYTPEQFLQLVKWCRKHGADEWTLTTTPIKNDRSGAIRHFEEVNEPFRLPPAERRQLTMSGGKPFLRPTPLWRLNTDALNTLQQFLPEGLFSYSEETGGVFEDPVFYRNGELMLGVVSHEEEGIIRVTPEEYRSLRAQDFIIRDFGTYVGY